MASKERRAADIFGFLSDTRGDLIKVLSGQMQAGQAAQASQLSQQQAAADDTESLRRFDITSGLNREKFEAGQPDPGQAPELTKQQAFSKIASGEIAPDDPLYNAYLKYSGAYVPPTKDPTTPKPTDPTIQAKRIQDLLSGQTEQFQESANLRFQPFVSGEEGTFSEQAQRQEPTVSQGGFLGIGGEQVTNPAFRPAQEVLFPSSSQGRDSAAVELSQQFPGLADILTKNIQRPEQGFFNQFLQEGGNQPQPAPQPVQQQQPHGADLAENLLIQEYGQQEWQNAPDSVKQQAINRKMQELSQ